MKLGKPPVPLSGATEPEYTRPAPVPDAVAVPETPDRATKHASTTGRGGTDRTREEDLRAAAMTLLQHGNLVRRAEHPDAETTGMNVRLPEYLADALRAQARLSGKGAGAIVAEALRAHLDPGFVAHYFGEACRRLGLPEPGRE
jgi:hypothetical protein